MITQKHDKGYSRIFADKKNFLHFLKKYVDVDFVRDIEEDDLIHIDTTLIDENYREIESDVIFKMRFKGSNVLFYCLLELQSTSDNTMPFRLLRYITELMKREFDNTDENERKRINYRLPAVIPIVLYNGTNGWTAVRSFKEYLQGYERFGEYVVDFKYLLFDLNRTDDDTILSTETLLDIVLMLDKSTNRSSMERAFKKAHEMFQQMDESDKDELMRWLRLILLSNITDESKKLELLQDFEKGEVSKMKYGIDFYFEERMEEGVQRGKLEGMLEGKLETQREIILSMHRGGENTNKIAKYADLSIEEVNNIIYSDN